MESATTTASKNTQLDKLLDGAAANMEKVGKPLDADGAGALCDVTKDLWALSVPKVPHYQPSNMSVYRGLINACLNHHHSFQDGEFISVSKKSSLAQQTALINETLLKPHCKTMVVSTTKLHNSLTC